jgi:enduracididine beta-hydroxylase
MTNRFLLLTSEIDEVRSLIDEITRRFDSAEDPTFLHEAAVHGQGLPRRLRLFLNDFRLREPDPGLCVISGYPLDDRKIGDTPEHWKERRRPSLTLHEEVFLVLVGSLLGEPIGWATQQSGYIVHDVFPIRGNEQEQLGTGCEVPLAWHTEDAFHPCRGDYIALMCLRNPDRVGTTWAAIDPSQLCARHRQLLFEPRFTIRPDESHLTKNSSRPVDKALLSDAYARIAEMNTAPPKIAVLYGNPERPYLRIDPYFMDPLVDDPEAQAALDALAAMIESQLVEEVSAPGDVFILDNYRLVHGRKSFKARYDGRDRWLKRINISRDLRKSRALRTSAESRVLHG